MWSATELVTFSRFTDLLNISSQILKNLPLYEALINDLDDGIFAVSLVSAPATESDWVCFSKQE